MPTSTVEDYLKAILLVEQTLPTEQLVNMGQIGQALSVAPGTVTAMVKALGKGGLLHYEPYSGVRLSASGRRAAIRVLRRHRLIELFLVETLGLDWSEVHEEAERLEHAMSDKVIDRIDRLLGFPRVDPHGDPIPDVAGEMPDQDQVNLSDASGDRSWLISRVSDQDEEFLKFADRHGLKPGSAIKIEKRDPVARALTIKPAELPAVTIGFEAAAKLWLVGSTEEQ
jgi:DtxR family transcriptional regulator, Mn-dependent transcriptional regulator